MKNFTDVDVAPAVAEPGKSVRIKASIAPEELGAGQLAVKVTDASGALLVETLAHTYKAGVRGEFVVPAKTPNGAYDVSILSSAGKMLSSTLIVLAKTSLKHLWQASAAERKKSEAYQSVANNRPNLALTQLGAAERFYRNAGWTHLEGETIIERAHILAKIGKHGQYRRALREAMLRFNQAGMVCLEGQAYGKASFYFGKAREVAKEIKDEKSTAINSNNLGEAQLLVNAVEEARTNFLLALDIATRVGAKNVEATVRKNLAAVYSLQSRYQEAMEELSVAARLYRQIGDRVRARETRAERAQLARQVEDKLGTFLVAPPTVLGDLQESLCRWTEKFKSIAEQSKISLLLEISSNIPKVLINHIELSQLIHGLLQSGIALAPEGSKIRITAMSKPAKARLGVEIVEEIHQAQSQESQPEAFEVIEPNLPSPLAGCERILRQNGGYMKVMIGSNARLTITVWIPSAQI